jgi:hypothetical protein
VHHVLQIRSLNGGHVPQVTREEEECCAISTQCPPQPIGQVGLKGCALPMKQAGVSRWAHPLLTGRVVAFVSLSAVHPTLARCLAMPRPR